jgi:hypothetical protein
MEARPFIVRVPDFEEMIAARSHRAGDVL